MTTTIVDPVSRSAAYTAGSSTTKASNEASASDRFLTLLVAQMENQDPLNPMDNAQVTSQMAQISTVSGIEKPNTTMGGLNSQFLQSQTLQAAALVGHDVVLGGNQLSLGTEGQPQVMFELASPADNVTIEILSAGGSVLHTATLKSLDTGFQSFDWKPKSESDLSKAETFRVTAKTGTATVGASLLMRDQVAAVATGADGLKLQLSKFGSVTMDQIKTFN
jgi:flagellar basal-body rod modification protein FlgD